MNVGGSSSPCRGQMAHAPLLLPFRKHTMPLTVALLLILTHPIAPALAQAAENSSPANGPARQEQPYDSVEERRIMEAMKASGNRQFTDEKAELERRQKELKRLESEVDKKIDQLNQLRVKVEQLLQQKNAEEQKRILELAKMYEKMSAEKASLVLGNLETPLAIAILSKMKTKSAAKILNNMEREKAAKLTTAFSTLDTR